MLHTFNAALRLKDWKEKILSVEPDQMVTEMYSYQSPYLDF